MADAFDDRLDGIAQSSEGFVREAAGACLRAREVATVEKKHAMAGARQIISGGAAGGASADDQGIAVMGHWPQFSFV